MDKKEGKAIHELAKELWPIGRSITGQGEGISRYHCTNIART